MMKLVYAYYEQGTRALQDGASIDALVKMKVRERIGRFKYVHEDSIDGEYKDVLDALALEISQIGKED